MPQVPEHLADIDPTVNTDLDDRISFDQLNQKWIYEEADLEFEYDTTEKKWVYVDAVEEDSKKRGADEDAHVQFKKLKKQKLQELKEQQKQALQEKKKKSTGCYVSNLPMDISVEELESLFGKYGMLSEDLLTGQKRIKLYKDEQGSFSGDALVIYHRQESVDLAIQMLDDTPIRMGEANIKVQQASFKDHATEATDGIKTKKILSDEEKKLINKKLQKINNKLNDWDENSRVRTAEEQKNDKVVVLKNCFKLKEINEDEHAISDIEEDIREGCSTIAEPKNVTLFDLEPEGVVTVRFGNKEDATACIEMMNGRFFGGSELEAFRFTGESFRKSVRGVDEDEEEQRLERFGDWLEKE